MLGRCYSGWDSALISPAFGVIAICQGGALVGGDRRQRRDGAGGRGLRAEGAGVDVGLTWQRTAYYENAPLGLAWWGAFICPAIGVNFGDSYALTGSVLQVVY